MVANRWRVVFAGVMILMCLGVAYSWGVFLVPINAELGWGRARISFAVSVLLLVFSVFMAIGGLVEKKLGPRKTAGMGGIFVGLGWVLASFSHTPFEMYLYYGTVAGIGTGLGYMPSIASGIKWFPEKKGLVTGIIVCGFGFGTAFLSPLMTRLIELYGWRPTMRLGGLAFAAVIIIAAQFLKVPRFTGEAQAAGGINDKGAYSPSRMLRTRAFWVMFAAYFMAMVAGMMTIGHITAFVLDRQFSAMQGALALTVLAACNGAGRIVFGAVSDCWGGRRTLLVLYSFIALGMFLLNHAQSLYFIYGISALIGLCFGGFLAVYPPLTADYFGTRDFAVNYGLVFIGYGSGCFLGPLIGGMTHDATGNYVLAFNAAGIVALAGGLLIFLFLKRPGMPRLSAGSSPAVSGSGG